MSNRLFQSVIHQMKDAVGGRIIGVIDETYCGDNDQWYFPARADRHTVIHVGDRICQFRIEKHQPQLFFEPVDTLGNADRGGIGSTGKR